MSHTLHLMEASHAGWLSKPGGKLRSWKRRYFKLLNDHLYYFAKDADEKPLGEFCVTGVSISELPFNPEDPQKYLFEIKPGEGHEGPLVNNLSSLVLWAGSKDERREWIRAFRRVMFAAKGGAIFGQSLIETMRYETTQCSHSYVPTIVSRCLDFVSQHGMTAEGIFRLAGRSAVVRQLQEAWDCAAPPVFTPALHDVHTVASLLKLYLRELPEPLITAGAAKTLLKKVVQLERDSETDACVLRPVVELLPPHSFNLLKRMCMFLKRLSANSKETKMTVSNLALIFSPTVMHQGDGNLTQLGAASMVHKVVYMFIAHAHVIFRMDYSPTGDPVRVGTLVDVGNSEWTNRVGGGLRTFEDLGDLDDLFSVDDGFDPLGIQVFDENVKEAASLESVEELEGTLTRTGETDDATVGAGKETRSDVVSKDDVTAGERKKESSVKTLVSETDRFKPQDERDSVVDSLEEDIVHEAHSTFYTSISSTRSAKSPNASRKDSAKTGKSKGVKALKDLFRRTESPKAEDSSADKLRASRSTESLDKKADETKAELTVDEAKDPKSPLGALMRAVSKKGTRRGKNIFPPDQHMEISGPTNVKSVDAAAVDSSSKLAPNAREMQIGISALKYTVQKKDKTIRELKDALSIMEENFILAREILQDELDEWMRLFEVEKLKRMAAERELGELKKVCGDVTLPKKPHSWTVSSADSTESEPSSLPSLEVSCQNKGGTVAGPVGTENVRDCVSTSSSETEIADSKKVREGSSVLDVGPSGHLPIDITDGDKVTGYVAAESENMKFIDSDVVLRSFYSELRDCDTESTSGRVRASVTAEAIVEANPSQTGDSVQPYGDEVGKVPVPVPVDIVIEDISLSAGGETRMRDCSNVDPVVRKTVESFSNSVVGKAIAMAKTELGE